MRAAFLLAPSRFVVACRFFDEPIESSPISVHRGKDYARREDGARRSFRASSAARRAHRIAHEKAARVHRRLFAAEFEFVSFRIAIAKIFVCSKCLHLHISAVRAEELLYDKLELKKDNTQRPNNLEHLSQVRSTILIVVVDARRLESLVSSLAEYG